jgi:hypothetical protein
MDRHQHIPTKLSLHNAMDSSNRYHHPCKKRSFSSHDTESDYDSMSITQRPNFCRGNRHHPRRTKIPIPSDIQRDPNTVWNSEQERSILKETSPTVVFAKVRHLYTQYDALAANAKVMLDLPLDDRLLQPIDDLKWWLCMMTPTINLCVREHQARLLRTNHKITEFFPKRMRRDTNQKKITAFFPKRSRQKIDTEISTAETRMDS